MQDYRYPKLVRSERTKARYQIALALAILGAALLFIAVRFQSRIFLVSTPAERHAGRTYSQMWFDSGEALVGAFTKGSVLTIDRWSEKRSVSSAQVQLSAPDSRWAIAPDFGSVAWIDGAAAYVERFSDQTDKKRAPVVIALPKGRTPLTIGILSDGSVAIVFPDASVERWDGAKGIHIEQWRPAVNEADQAVIREDYLAISSSRAGRLLLYHFQDQREWKMVEEAPSPDPPYRLVIPAPGLMAELTAAGLRMGRETRNSPGAIQSLVSQVDRMIAAGDFDNIFVLPGDMEFYRLADAPPGTTLAAGRTRLGVSGREGTSLFDLSTVDRLTSSGRALARVSILLLAAAAILACFAFLRDGISFLLKLFLRKHWGGAEAPGQLPDPPLDLLEACVSGQAMLWGGAGLSAQAGFPLRENFIATVLRTASVEGWLDPSRALKLQGQCARGNGELALNALVAETASIRGHLIEHYRAIYSRFTVPSRSHEMLARIQFAIAVTTNYDPLFEVIRDAWAANVMTLSSAPPRQASADVNDPCFLVKLYGDPAKPPTMILSRFEFESMAPTSLNIELVRKLFATRAVLFTGCSVEGLLADLNGMRVLEQAAHKHFAPMGVSGLNWKRAADELSRKWGIEVLPCKEETIATELPRFLESLARQVEQRRYGSEGGAAEALVADEKSA